MSGKMHMSDLLVRVFNQILAWEENNFKSHEFDDLTLRELHVLEAVFGLKENDSNRMSEIAKYLSITPGSLTTSVNALVKKGYLMRRSKAGDRRVVIIVPTQKAVAVNNIHSNLRAQMIDEILAAAELGNSEMEFLYGMIEKLNLYFDEKQNTRK